MIMEKAIRKNKDSKGASIFKKILEDKNAIHEHLKKGGKINDLKETYQFVKPLPTRGK
jgi:hypothetical protein